MGVLVAVTLMAGGAFGQQFLVDRSGVIVGGGEIFPFILLHETAFLGFTFVHAFEAPFDAAT